MAAERHGRTAVIALAAAAAACFATIGLLRHGNWWSGLDLGLFSQSVWHWGNLEAPLSTLKGDGNLLGDHFSPIVALLAPAAWTGREPEALVIAQALLVAASILPVHSYARDRCPPSPRSASRLRMPGRGCSGPARCSSSTSWPSPRCWLPWGSSGATGAGGAPSRWRWCCSRA